MLAKKSNSMIISDLKPANEYARLMGVKSIIYGPAGTGKTRLVITAPRPVLLATEPGMLSMRDSTVPTYQAFTTKAIDEFMLWWFTSAETKNFDTLCIDSTSQLCETYLIEAKKTVKHGLQAYGQMAEQSMTHFRRLFFQPNKHMIMIAKEEIKDVGGYPMRRPAYPGQQLPIEMPHLFDLILHINKAPIPGVGETLAFRCQGNAGVLARDRTGRLNEFEEPHMGKLIQKVMS